jgi:hypothetical protein
MTPLEELGMVYVEAAMLPWLYWAYWVNKMGESYGQGRRAGHVPRK